MINSNVSTVILDGNETAVEFSSGYPYYFVTNKGNADIYVSVHSGIKPEADGVYAIPAGGTERIGEGYHFKKIYILGTGKAQVQGSRIAVIPSFNRTGKGGESTVSSYSTDERIIGTWIDGKPLYQKTVYAEYNYTNSQKIPHNIENVDIIWLDNSATFSLDKTLMKTMPFMNTGIDDYGGFVNSYLGWIQGVDRQGIIVRQGSQSGLDCGYITVRYTKTTD